MSPPDARIGTVVLNWNNSADTLACLESLFGAQPRCARVVLVDNASSDDSVRRFESWAAERGVQVQRAPEGDAGALGADAPLTLLVARRNRGFAGGNNIGLRWLRDHTDCTHFLLLNNDATVAQDFFSQMARALEAAPAAGLLTGTIYEEPRRDLVWYAGGVERKLRSLMLHTHQQPAGDAPVHTDFVSGCAMLISRALLERLGPLAEIYFPLYYEDAEYSRRARASGFPVLYAPAATVFHKVGATVGAFDQSPRVAYTQNRLRGVYIRRNYRGTARLAALGYLWLTKPGKAVVMALGGKPRIGWAVLTGMLAGLRGEVEDGWPDAPAPV